MTCRERVEVVAIAAALMMIGGGLASAQDCVSGATFTGPITITSGGTYTGNWQRVDPATPVVQIVTTQPVTIVNSRLRGPGDLVLSGIRPT